jgi:phage terminase Nu1 subunit (DNA packaging protein)
MSTVDVERVANALNIEPRRVQQLVKEGMPREKRGEYDAVKCLFWYVRYLQAHIKRLSPNTSPEGSEGDNERKQRVRLLRAEADLKELELARERGEFVALADVEKIMTDLVVTTKARILAVASRVAPELVGEPRTVIEAKLDRALKGALTALANYGENGNGSGVDTPERIASLATHSVAHS